MLANFQNVRVGNPLRFKQLSVFPLFAEAVSEVDYLLADEAIPGGSVTVKEISETGSVPELCVENKGQARVLFLEGEELVGAKQNRILNVSILVAAGSTVRIPVSCVEEGRWGYRSHKFTGGGTHSPPKLRYALKASVSKSLKANRGYHSDQGQVWEEVAKQEKLLGTPSPTGAMADTFEAYRDQVSEFQDALKYVDGACGVAIAVGNQVVGLDVFDKTQTCAKVWDRLLSGAILSGIATPQDDVIANPDQVTTLLEDLNRLPWESRRSVGEGEEHRAESTDGLQASVLALDGSVVHGSVMVPC